MTKAELTEMINQFERAGLSLAAQIVTVRRAIDGPRIHAPDARAIWHKAICDAGEAPDA